MTEFERYKGAIENILEYVAGEFRSFDTVSKMAEDALYPPPEYEEVEVVRWVVVRPNGTVLSSHDTEDEARTFTNGHHTGVRQIIPLTGTLRRPKPQKVERSVSVVAWVVKDHVCYLDGSVLLDERASAPLMESYPETHGKQGLLTFTWTEEGDGK